MASSLRGVMGERKAEKHNAELDLLLNRVNDLIEFRIDAVLHDMSTTVLCDLPEDEPLSCEEFVQMTKELCVRGAQTLHSKSTLVEEAANELINMLLDVELHSRDDVEKSKAESRMNTKSSVTENEDDDRKTEMRTTLSRSTSQVTGGPHSPLTKRKKKRDTVEVLEEEARELLSHFNHRNVEALLKVTRNTLESIRKRIHVSSLIHFLDNDNSNKQRTSNPPIFRTNITLSIPNIVMVPALDEVQQALNRAVEYIVSITKGVSQWSKERIPKKEMHERKIEALHRERADSESDDGILENGLRNAFGNSVFYCVGSKLHL
ncbi:dynein axonemal heavy chain 5-like [Protopterus annectens]|uniref:dynein axonemal heavy chain 5-like n=1 Tax=Protopterus annectens TaxID=7888 RepID=UPI001CFA8463|nr:dynein axonemal heavy chain 5-like [Protopterus annectens]